MSKQLKFEKSHLRLLQLPHLQRPGSEVPIRDSQSSSPHSEHFTPLLLPIDTILFGLCIISMVKEYHCDCGAVLDNSGDIDRGTLGTYYCTYCDEDIGDVGEALYNS